MVAIAPALFPESARGTSHRATARAPRWTILRTFVIALPALALPMLRAV